MILRHGDLPMNIPSDDQNAKIRFAFKVYSTGNTYGASASTVKQADDAIEKIVSKSGHNHLRPVPVKQFRLLYIKHVIN